MSFAQRLKRLATSAKSAQWDVCKSPGFPSNRTLLRGKSIRQLCESLWFVPCLLDVSLLLKRFCSSLAWFAGSSATHTLSKNISWCFRSWWSEKDGSYSTQKASRRQCATPPRHLSKKQKWKDLGLNNVPAWFKIYICVHAELFTGSAVRFAVKISQKYCAAMLNPIQGRGGGGHIVPPQVNFLKYLKNALSYRVETFWLFKWTNF